MSDEKPKPVDDLKEGLGLLFRAAKGAVDMLPTDKIEGAAKDAVKEVSRAFESLGGEIDKVMGKKQTQPPPADPNAHVNAEPREGKDAPKYDDGYAPDPPKGPRVS